MRIAIILLFVLFSGASGAQPVRQIKITDLEQTIKESTTPLIVNFWATFCIPCIQEIPYFLQQAAAFKKDSVQLLLVSLDLPDEYPDGIARFIQKRKITAPVVWLNETNADYFCPKVDSNWSGAIPATLFVNNARSYRRFHEDQLSEAQLIKEIRKMLGQ
ncbi:TlpA family protein disulfide reductase [Nostoc ellipsosporum NOK]|nr:TlpA family protein disulfide reductase [Nostoc ellipsosporum NOK]